MRIKAKVEIVTGFLGVGKTTFLNVLVESTLVKDEKVLVIQCEEGEQCIDNNIRNSNQVVIKACDPQNQLTVKYLKYLIDLHRPHRIIIESNGSRRLEGLLYLLDEKEVLKRCKVSAIYNITDAITYEMFVNNMGSIILDSIHNSDLIILTNIDCVSKQKLKITIKHLEKSNSHAFILQVDNIKGISSVLKEKNILFKGYAKKISITSRNLLSN
jgi:G3E family GTPase